MRRRERVPATLSGQTWTTHYHCTNCGEAYTHVEHSLSDDDEPYGLPFELRWCECGGFLLARKP